MEGQEYAGRRTSRAALFGDEAEAAEEEEGEEGDSSEEEAEEGSSSEGSEEAGAEGSSDEEQGSEEEELPENGDADWLHGNGSGSGSEDEDEAPEEEAAGSGGAGRLAARRAAAAAGGSDDEEMQGGSEGEEEGRGGRAAVAAPAADDEMAALEREYEQMQQVGYGQGDHRVEFRTAGRCRANTWLCSLRSLPPCSAPQGGTQAIPCSSQAVTLAVCLPPLPSHRMSRPRWQGSRSARLGSERRRWLSRCAAVVCSTAACCQRHAKRTLWWARRCTAG